MAVTHTTKTSFFLYIYISTSKCGERGWKCNANVSRDNSMIPHLILRFFFFLKESSRWGLLNCNSTKTHIEELIFFSLITQTNSMWSHTGAAGGGGQLWHHDNQGDQTLSIWPQLATVQACSRKPRLPRGSQSGEIGQQRVSCIKPGNKSWVSKTVWNSTLQLYYCFNSMKGKKKNFNSI